MKRKKYNPSPLDLTEVKLSDEMLELTDSLARNVHEIWAKNRIEHGWSYGPARDDALKRHPCIIPYDELSEEEKLYDKNTAMETIKAILSLGFEIRKVPTTSGH